MRANDAAEHGDARGRRNRAGVDGAARNSPFPSAAEAATPARFRRGAAKLGGGLGQRGLVGGGEASGGSGWCWGGFNRRRLPRLAAADSGQIPVRERAMWLGKRSRRKLRGRGVSWCDQMVRGCSPFIARRRGRKQGHGWRRAVATASYGHGERARTVQGVTGVLVGVASGWEAVRFGRPCAASMGARAGGRRRWRRPQVMGEQGVMSGRLMGWRGSDWRERAARGGLWRMDGARRLGTGTGAVSVGGAACWRCLFGLGVRQWATGS